MSDSPRFARLKEIFLEAQGLSGRDRELYLDRVCGDDAGLWADVNALLEDAERVSALLRTGGAIEDFLEGASADAEAAVPSLPDRIGEYEITGLLGEGGMGVVYEARQGDPRRLVALKVIRSGPVIDAKQVKMFRREELALARLEHPGIASIYAAGQTEGGRHYFAMELVRGEPLDRYLAGAGRDLAVEARLRLFLKACDAVDYAHRAGIIHRDLKPSNIMVPDRGAGSGTENGSDTRETAGEPEVKVLDFGLAKITDADVTMMSLASEAGRVQGTLAYMSPEQARGDMAAVDARTDVYALGVILYEMLTGKRPYELHPFLVPQAVRTICEREPTRPGSVDMALRGDLEVILLKALEKDPGRRYANVAALAEDVRRFLSRRPILARPPSTVYQFRKLVARHRAPFAAAAMLFVLAIAFGATMTVMYRAQVQERARAETAALKAQRINRFMQDMLAAPNPEVGGRDITVREVLDAKAAEIDSSLSDEPEVKAQALITIGNTYGGLGLHDEAVRCFREALAIREELFDPPHQAVAWALNGLGHALLARGDLAEAESTLTVALEMRRELLGENSNDVAWSLDGLAGVLVKQGRWEEAVPMYRQALAIRRRVHPPDHPDVAGSRNDLAVALWTLDRYEEAEPLYREALEVSRRQLGEDHPNVVTMTDNLALILSQEGKIAEAESLHHWALEKRLELLGEEHPMIGVSCANLGACLEIQERYEEAEAAFRRSVAVLRGAFGNNHPFTGLALTNLSYCFHRTAANDSAEAYYRETIAVQEAILPDENPDLNLTRELFATLLIDTGRAGEAEALLRAVAGNLERSLPEDHWRQDGVRCRLAWCRAALGREAEADSLMQETRATVLAIPNIRWRMDFLRRNADLYRAWGKPKEAEVYRGQLEVGGV